MRELCSHRELGRWFGLVLFDGLCFQSLGLSRVVRRLDAGPAIFHPFPPIQRAACRMRLFGANRFIIDGAHLLVVDSY